MDGNRQDAISSGAWWTATAGVLVALAVPFFLVDVLPVLDYPNHLARLYVLAFGPDDPVPSAMYAPHWSVVPNLAIDLVGPPLMHVLRLHAVGRVLLAASALLPVIGVVLYHPVSRTVGDSCFG